MAAINPIDLYAKYCRPVLGASLKALRLDKNYHKGLGDCLYYLDETGQEQKVIDFLGGYGASLFGHNHPDLVRVAKNFLEQHVPFNAQASCRRKAGELGRKLSELMHPITGRQFITVLANTGTEATEAAMKHAELAHYRKLEAMEGALEQELVRIQAQLRQGNLALAPQCRTLAAEKLETPSHAGFPRIADAVKAYNHHLFQQRPCFISLERSFHGKTSGSVQLTHFDQFREPFMRLGPEVIFVEPEKEVELDAAIDKTAFEYLWPEITDKNEVFLRERRHANITGIFIEPIQGEGGVHVLSQAFLKACRTLADNWGFPLIFDEIQCGMGRTGTFIYSQQTGVVADYYLFAKSLGGGLSKISALLVHDEAYIPEFGMIHSSTFAEDDFSAAIALKSLEMLEQQPKLMNNCRQKGAYLMEKLAVLKGKYPSVISDVRGRGLMIGLEFHRQDRNSSGVISTLSNQKQLGFVIAGYLLNKFQIRVAPTLSSSATIRLEPSAKITKKDCDHLLRALDSLCETIWKANAFELTNFIIEEESYSKQPQKIRNYRKETARYEKPKYAGKVAFIGHFISSEHMVLWDEALANFSDTQLEIYLRKIYPMIGPEISTRRTVRSITGELVNLNFIGLCVDSKIIMEHLISGNIEPILSKVRDAVDMAIKEGCSVVGFGGYTSIITQNCEKIVTNAIGLTTGNSLTAGMGLEGIFKAAADAGIELGQSCFAALGAGGNIASIYSELISEKVPRVLLIGKPGREAKLERVAGEIYFSAFKEILRWHSLSSSQTQLEQTLTGVAKEICYTRSVQHLLETYASKERIGLWLYQQLNKELREKAPVKVVSDLKQMKQANLILGASNAASPLIFPEMLGDGPIVICDISVPMDTDMTVRKTRSDVTIIRGGVVRLPFNPEFSVNGIPLEGGLSFACMGETLLLGLTGITEPYSYGRVNKIQVKKIMDLAKVHGFSLARLQTENTIE